MKICFDSFIKCFTFKNLYVWKWWTKSHKLILWSGNDTVMVNCRTLTVKVKSNKCLFAGLYLEVGVLSAAQFPVPGLFSSHEMWVLTGSTWGDKWNTRMTERINWTKTSPHPVVPKMPTIKLHPLVWIDVLHCYSHSITYTINILPVRILGHLDTLVNRWRVHSLCDIFFPKNQRYKQITYHVSGGSGNPTTNMHQAGLWSNKEKGTWKVIQVVRNQTCPQKLLSNVHNFAHISLKQGTTKVSR